MFRRLFGRDQPAEPNPAADNAGQTAGNATPPSAEPAWQPEGEPPTRADGETDRDFVARLAQHYLPPDDADRWLQLLRPAVRLLPTENRTAALARLGGLPRLPAELDWPQWPGHGPLSYLGEIFCSGTSAFELDIALPDSGRLLLFYFDGSIDGGMSVVGPWDPSSMSGARLIHLPDDARSAERELPDGVQRYHEAVFTGEQIVSSPGWDHPDFHAAFLKPGQQVRDLLDQPVAGEEFSEALDHRHEGALHQLGGHAFPVQGPVESEVAEVALAGQSKPTSDQLAAEAARWSLLVQLDSDDTIGAMWGDAGILYWLGRPDQLAAGNLDNILFTWQCG